MTLAFKLVLSDDTKTDRYLCPQLSNEINKLIKVSLNSYVRKPVSKY